VRKSKIKKENLLKMILFCSRKLIKKLEASIGHDQLILKKSSYDRKSNLEHQNITGEQYFSIEIGIILDELN
jgi:hypothetical protein